MLKSVLFKIIKIFFKNYTNKNIFSVLEFVLTRMFLTERGKLKNKYVCHVLI